MFLMLPSSAVLVVLVVYASCASGLAFTGDVEKDFDSPLAVKWIDNLDVGVPPAFPYHYSGWDVKDVRFFYDADADQLSVGLNFFGVAGDADGDGFPSASSEALKSRGGTDLPNFEFSESCSIAFDLGSQRNSTPDGTFDFVIGYPAQEADSSEPFPCGSNFDTSCFGLYLYDNSLGVDPVGQRFVYRRNSSLLQTANAGRLVVDHNSVASVERPDLEWSIEQFNVLRAALDLSPVDGTLPFTFNVIAFCGSYQDDGLGEDTVPNDAPSLAIEIPCSKPGAGCDVCKGNGDACLDCRGVPFGSFTDRSCVQCGGSTPCDCRGVPNGATQFDECDVCGGDNRSCADCAGTPNGSAVRDKCGVCGGNNVCTDCAGTEFGSKQYDECGVCDGNGQSCAQWLTPKPTPAPTPKPTPLPRFTAPPTPPTPAPAPTRWNVQFTGDVEKDFAAQVAGPTVAVIVDGDGQVDVGFPPNWPFDASGWDVKDMRFVFDASQDALHIGVNCYGVCGDADGDGDAGGTGEELAKRGGQDLPRFAMSESLSIRLRFSESEDFVVGYPAGESDWTDNFLCSSQFDVECFGLYRYSADDGVEQLGQRFLYKQSDPLITNSLVFGYAIDHNNATSVFRPDLEWTVQFVGTLAPDAMATAMSSGSLTFDIAMFAGSFQDDGVGEDSFPNASEDVSVTLSTVGWQKQVAPVLPTTTTTATTTTTTTTTTTPPPPSTTKTTPTPTTSTTTTTSTASTTATATSRTATTTQSDTTYTNANSNALTIEATLKSAESEAETSESSGRVSVKSQEESAEEEEREEESRKEEDALLVSREAEEERRRLAPHNDANTNASLSIVSILATLAVIFL